jgi:hypothetical protein
MLNECMCSVWQILSSCITTVLGSWVRSFIKMTGYRLKCYISHPHSAWIFILPHFQTSSVSCIISCQVCTKVLSRWYLNLTAHLTLRVRVENVCNFAFNSELIFKGWCLGIGLIHVLACFKPLIPKRFTYFMCFVFSACLQARTSESLKQVFMIFWSFTKTCWYILILIKICQ